MICSITSYDQLPLTLCAEHISQILGISRSATYTLLRSKGFPTIYIGKRMVVPKDKFIAWIEEQTAGEECAWYGLQESKLHRRNEKWIAYRQ